MGSISKQALLQALQSIIDHVQLIISVVQNENNPKKTNGLSLARKAFQTNLAKSRDDCDEDEIRLNLLYLRTFGDYIFKEDLVKQKDTPTELEPKADINKKRSDDSSRDANDIFQPKISIYLLNESSLDEMKRKYAIETRRVNATGNYEIVEENQDKNIIIPGKKRKLIPIDKDMSFFSFCKRNKRFSAKIHSTQLEKTGRCHRTLIDSLRDNGDHPSRRRQNFSEDKKRDEQVQLTMPKESARKSGLVRITKRLFP
ncbi:hypothetical protein ACOME3_001954 [Neoechinorhynchus agilis]